MFHWTKTRDLDKKKLFKNAATYTILGLALFAIVIFGMFDRSGSGPGQSLPGGAAAKVNGKEISNATFRRTYRDAYEQYQKQSKEGFDPRQINLSGKVMSQLVDDYIIYHEAVKNGIAAGTEEVADLILSSEGLKDESGKFDPAKFKGYLRNQDYTEKSLEEELGQKLTNDKFRQFIAETQVVSKNASKWSFLVAETKYDVEYLKFDKSKIKTTTTDEEVQTYLADENNKKTTETYYNSHKSEFTSPKKVHASHILTTFAGSRNATGEGAKRTKEEAKIKAQSLRSKILEPNSPGFDKIAKESTDDPTGKSNGGDLGFFVFEDMAPEVSTVAFNQKVGDISEIVESPFGYHIIKVNGVKEKKDTSQEEAYKIIAKRKIDSDKKPLAAVSHSNSVLAKLKDGKSIDQDLKTLDLEWASTGSFSLEGAYINGLGASKDLKNAIIMLKKAGDLHRDVVDDSGNKFILRLKSITAADLNKFDDKKQKELSDRRRYYDAYSLYTAYKDLFIKNHKLAGSIWENAEFRDRDLMKAGDAAKPGA